MNVRKFSAQTSREALRMVRDALGPDAVILSNRSANGSVEILALASADMASLSEPSVEKEVLPQPLVAALAGKRLAQSQPQQPQPQAQPQPQPQAASPSQSRLGSALSAFERLRPTPVTAPAPVAEAPSPQPAPVAAAIPRATTVDTHQAEMRQMMDEIRSMRGMLESQLAEISWGAQHRREPLKATVMREMLAAGFSASLARYLTEKLPEQGAVDPMVWIKSVLTRNLSAAPDENAILDNGGVFALVGPTGVGKTTTTAKLAARCVMRHGAGKLALITTDGYRIGGFEQLRIYGKILGVMVHSVKDEADLRIALSELKNKHTVLIDTAGAGQRDQMVAEQVAMLSGAETPVRRILCMSATSTGETLNEVVKAFKGNGLAGAIITKLDEAATIGSVLDVIIRQKLQLQYIANGQRVPEDLHLARPNFLIDRAFKMKRESAPFQYQDDELPLVIGNTAPVMNDKSLREVNLG
ncbi:MAG: flhF [Burkholderia sp.]|nr:flhF [Burkholderia sp.]